MDSKRVNSKKMSKQPKMNNLYANLFRDQSNNEFMKQQLEDMKKNGKNRIQEIDDGYEEDRNGYKRSR